MRWRVQPVAVVAVTAGVTGAGCSQTVGGTARRSQSRAPAPNRSYGYVDNRCGLLADSSIQQTIGAAHLLRPFRPVAARRTGRRRPPHRRRRLAAVSAAPTATGSPTPT